MQKTFLPFHFLPATKSLKHVLHSVLGIDFLEEPVPSVSGTGGCLFPGASGGPGTRQGSSSLWHRTVSLLPLLPDALLIWVSQACPFLQLDLNYYPGSSLGPEP